MYHNQKDRLKAWLWAVIGVTSAGIQFLGCIGSDYDSTESLSHIQPAHWPKNMAHAAELIETRMNVVKADPSAQSEFAELSDLISWAAEIAADTELSEGDWNAIYEASERLRKELLSKRSFSGLFDEVQQLVVLLKDAHRQVDFLRSSDPLRYPVTSQSPSEPGEE